MELWVVLWAIKWVVWGREEERGGYVELCTGHGFGDSIWRWVRTENLAVEEDYFRGFGGKRWVFR